MTNSHLHAVCVVHAEVMSLIHRQTNSHLQAVCVVHTEAMSSTVLAHCYEMSSSLVRSVCESLPSLALAAAAQHHVMTLLHRQHYKVLM